MSRLLPPETASVGDSAAHGCATPARGRLDSIDLLRGLVIVLMALDHVKGHFLHTNFDLIDLTKTTPAYFVTRWLTHFCAPTFVFLAGTGAMLYGARGRSKSELSWFLLTRGLWLVLLELTVVRFGMVANLNYALSFGQVIWAIGWSMVVLAGLVFLPVSAITVFGVAMIAFHNLFDHVTAADWGGLDWLWKILHTGESIEVLPGKVFSPFYPLIPWIGVLAAGYGFGAIFLLEPRRRRRELLGLGIALTLTFVALRFSNLYGDKTTDHVGSAGPWMVYHDRPTTLENGVFTVLSFVNCQKYPPSLAFLLMTLGPAIIALAIFDREPGPIGRVFVTFGRVPLFFYLLHWYVIKALLFGLACLHYGGLEWLKEAPEKALGEIHYGLEVVYLLWLGVVVFLYPLCYWFAGVKRRSRAAWLSYL